LLHDLIDEFVPDYRKNVTTQTDTTKVVGIRFSRVGKVYHFLCTIEELKTGDQVVVETSRGWQLGKVVQPLVDIKDSEETNLKQIDRKATPEDMTRRQELQQKEADVIALCREKSPELKFEGTKFVEAEFSFDESRLTILLNQEADEKLDIKPLRRILQKSYPNTQIELRQIGPRDVAKSLCGIGACGLEKRCCCSFLTEFSSISIRMAKEQGISLTPSEITGMCGRLRCCLIYEYENYVEARKELPKKNQIIKTPQGEGKVIDAFPLKRSVLVEIPETGIREIKMEDLQSQDSISSTVIAEAPSQEVVEQIKPIQADKKKSRRRKRRRS
jgi:cell fate regulator YaaT (PSP1 superfamily)